MNVNNRPLRFLYISNGFPPLTDPCSIRSFEISKRLIKENIFPIILTRQVGKNDSLDISCLKQIPPKLEYYRTSVISISPKLFLYNYIHWIPHAYFKAKKILKRRNDVKFIFATCPSYYSLIVGFLLKRKFKLPLIIEYNDPWSFNPYAEGPKITPNKIFNFFLEKKILNAADVIIILSSPLKDFLISHFPNVKNKTIRVLEHGIKDIKITDDKIRKDKKIIFSYAGSLYAKRSAVPLLKIISELNQEGLFNDVEFVFNIFGKYDESSLTSIINKLKISNLISLKGFIPREQVFTEIINSNLAIHIGEDLKYPTLSFKVMDYLSCRKKILYLGREDSYTSEFLKEHDFGDVIPLNNLNKGKEILKQIINSIKSGNYISEIEKVKLEGFSWEATVKKFLEIIQKILK
jgi:glycosyltransferase involved in cell wall biosynthesis